MRRHLSWSVLTFVALATATVALLAVLLVNVVALYAGNDGCAERIAARESGSSGGYDAVNRSSGAYGKYQLLPSRGAYAETPWARAGRSVYSLSPDEQEQVFAYIVAHDGYAPWGGC